MLVPRSTRPVLVTGALFLLAFSIYTTFRNHRSEWSLISSDWLPNLGQNGGGELIIPVSSEAGTRISQLMGDAHKLPAADAFLPHFKAVTQLQNVTMSEAKSTCTWGKNEEVNFQYGPGSDWVDKDRSDEELSFRRSQWYDFITNDLIPYETVKNKFSGRGIVILAGNGRSLKRVKVILRQLKILGSKLAIEIHHWENEMSLESRRDLEAMWPKIYFNDLSAPSNIIKTNNDNIFHVNYQLKTAAVINSRFAEILLLDSDNIPILDPSFLFHSSIYKEYGTLFWPDIARTRPSNPMWAITNTPCRMNEYEQESGQLIVDKRRFFYHLQLAAWFNNVHTGYYNEFLLGDKDMFRFAWHALKTKYGFVPKWVTSVGTISPTNRYCGHSFAQHAPNGSVAFLHGGLLKTIPKEVLEFHRKNNGGIFQAYKRSVVDEQHQFNERIGIRIDGVEDLPDRPKDMNGEWCTDLQDVTPRNLDEIVPGFGERFESLGGYWMLEEKEEDALATGHRVMRMLDEDDGV